MKLLMDTHAFLWLVEGHDRLSSAAAQALTDSENAVFLSVASVWELSIKSSRQSPHHHSDPFDRLLIAQAQVEGLTLVSADRQMKNYNLPVLW